MRIVMQIEPACVCRPPRAGIVSRRPRRTGFQAARPACTAPQRVACAREESASPRAACATRHRRTRPHFSPCHRTRRLSRPRRLYLPRRRCHRRFPRRRHQRHTTKCVPVLRIALRLIAPLAATVSFWITRRGRFSPTQGILHCTQGDRSCTPQPMEASTFIIGQQPKSGT